MGAVGTADPHRPQVASGTKSAFYDAAIQRYDTSAGPTHVLPPPSCDVDSIKADIGCSSAPERLLDAECDAAKSAVRAASPFGADSLASACSHISLQSSNSADELQDAAGLRTIRELQRGASGVIVLAEERDGATPVAVKLMPRDKAASPALQREMLTQRSCLMHPHVIQFKKAILMPSQLGIVMEYAAGGDLREYLEHNKPLDRQGGLSEGDARWFFQQLMLGLDFCHRLGIAHQDIKLENALLDRSSPKALLKLCDFGYSIRNEAHPEGPVTCHRAVGTPDYMAPELLLSPTSYDGKGADVWAAGVLLYTLLCGSFPFWRDEDEAQPQDPASRLRCMALRIVKAEYITPSSLSPGARSLLSRMLHPDVEERATVAEVMQHSWVRTDLPRDCMALNGKLMRMQPSRRAAACRQSDVDIKRIGRRMSFDL
jgi:serine/threonine-protein kinase SRK2